MGRSSVEAKLRQKLLDGPQLSTANFKYDPLNEASTAKTDTATALAAVTLTDCVAAITLAYTDITNAQKTPAGYAAEAKNQLSVNLAAVDLTSALSAISLARTTLVSGLAATDPATYLKAAKDPLSLGLAAVDLTGALAYAALAATQIDLALAAMPDFKLTIATSAVTTKTALKQTTDVALRLFEGSSVISS